MEKVKKKFDYEKFQKNIDDGEFTCFSLYDRYGYRYKTYEITTPHETIGMWGLAVEAIEGYANWFYAVPKNGYRHERKLVDVFELLSEEHKLELLSHLDLFDST